LGGKHRNPRTKSKYISILLRIGHSYFGLTRSGRTDMCFWHWALTVRRRMGVESALLSWRVLTHGQLREGESDRAYVGSL